MKQTGAFRHFRIAAFFFACTFSLDTQAADVIIGWGGPTTPEHAVVLRQSAQLALDEANQRNIVVQGERLHFKLMALDDKDNANFAAISARSFVAAKVTAVIGHYSTEATLAAAKIYAETELPMITVFSASPRITQQNYQNVFQLLGNIGAATNYMAGEFSRQEKSNRVAVAYGESAIGNAVADAVDQAMQKYGSRLVGRIPINLKTSDFNEVLDFISQKNVDILYFAGFHMQGQALSKRLFSIKTKTNLMLSGALFNADFFQSAGEYAEGTLIMLHGKAEKQLPGFAKFQSAYASKFGTPVMPYAMNAYDAANIIIEAIRRGGSTNPKVISQTLHTMKYAGLSGPIAFDATGRLLNPSYTLYQVKQGKWQPLRTFPDN